MVWMFAALVHTNKLAFFFFFFVAISWTLKSFPTNFNDEAKKFIDKTWNLLKKELKIKDEKARNSEILVIYLCQWLRIYLIYAIIGNISFINNNSKLFFKIEHILSKVSDIKYFREVFFLYFVLKFIRIVYDIIGLFLRACIIDRILNRFDMLNYKSEDIHIIKKDKFNKNRYSKNNVEKNNILIYRKMGFNWF